jgi:tRNA(Glu) U13 pseudouridine synthase TruD
MSYAGLKDKDAITAQKISLRNVPKGAVAPESPHYFLSEWEGGKGIVERGKLEGNRFTICMRTEAGFRESAAFPAFLESLEKVKTEGFANFFYLQRFGTPRLRNYVWARQILQGRYKDAVEDILSSEGLHESPYFVQIRTAIKEVLGNWDEVEQLLTPFPLIFEHELKLVRYLKEKPEDYAGALARIPEQITLWLYALSSILFNRMISDHLARGERPPQTLPFFLSDKREDQELYKHMLMEIDLYPLQLQNLRPFPFFVLKSRRTPTWSKAKLHAGELTPHGVACSFTLDKGQYATTFLSHLFTLVTGFPPEEFSKERVDTKALLNMGSVMPLRERFDPIIRSKGESAETSEE